MPRTQAHRSRKRNGLRGKSSSSTANFHRLIQKAAVHWPPTTSCRRRSATVRHFFGKAAGRKGNVPTKSILNREKSISYKRVTTRLRHITTGLFSGPTRTAMQEYGICIYSRAMTFRRPTAATAISKVSPRRLGRRQGGWKMPGQSWRQKGTNFRNCVPNRRL